jgi:Zn-dependent protease
MVAEENVEEVEFISVQGFLVWALDSFFILASFRYGVQLSATSGLGVPVIPDATKEVFRQHLNSFNSWAIVGSLTLFVWVEMRHVVCCLSVKIEHLVTKASDDFD